MIARFFFSLLMLFSSLSTTAQAEWVKQTRSLMTTPVTVEIWVEHQEQGEALLRRSFELVERYDKLLSSYKEQSEVSLVNREAAQHPVKVSKLLWELLQLSLHYSELSQGAFDITFASVGFDYDFRARRRPDEATLEQKRQWIDYRLVKLDPDTHSVRFLKPGVKIDLGGVAKGYIVDQVAALLAQEGIQHAAISAGGDSRLLGDRGGRYWWVGVRNPRGEGYRLKLPLADVAISTSGDYERFFDENGERYHHIINPATGEPKKGIQSVTIIADRAVASDALSTSVFVLGVKEGLALIESLADTSAIIIDGDGALHYSSDLSPPESN